MSPFPAFQPSTSSASVVNNQLHSAFSIEGSPSRKGSDFVPPRSSTSREFHRVLSKADKDSSKPASASEKKKRKPAHAADQPESHSVSESATAQIPVVTPSQPIVPPPSDASTDAPSLALKGASGKSVAQLLAEGVPVLEFGLPGKSAAAVPLAPGDSVANLPGAPADGAATVPAPGDPASVVDASGMEIATLPVTPGTTPDQAAKMAGISNSLIDPQTPQEKIAALAQNQASGGDNSSFENGKNQSLPEDYKLVANAVAAIGTPAANRVKAMPSATRILPTASSTSAFAHVAPSGGSDAATTFSATATPTLESSRASDLVHQIHEIADGLWAVDRNSVEVKFNFSEQEKLSVRVEYINGSVHATFRTDSTSLRDAIAHEWQSQQPGSGDSRPYQVADPVFTDAGLASNSFAGGDSSRQQRSDGQSVPFERISTFASSRSASATTAAPLVASSFRPDTAGHLHALV